MTAPINLAALREARDQAENDLRHGIYVAATVEGRSRRDIAGDVRLSHQRVHQIVDEVRGRNEQGGPGE